MSLLQPTHERIPYFAFRYLELGIDQKATAEKGYAVPKIELMIQITPHGHRGEPLEFTAEEFIARKRLEAMDDRYDIRWVEEFESGLKRFLQGQEIPRNGTPTITWERLAKSRREELAKMFPTLEDLAAVPDSTLSSIGMDGRVLRDLAKGDIQAKQNLEPVVQELADARAENENLQTRIASLEQQLAKLSALVEASKQ